MSLGNSCNRIKGGGESYNFSHSGSHITGVGNALLFCFNNCLFLLFDNYLLFCRSLSGEELFVESIHFSLESELFSGFTCLYLLCLSGFGHSLLFSNDDSLLFFGSICSSESGIECGDLCHKSIVASFTARNALLLCLYNGLLLFFNNSLLLCGRLSSGISGIEFVHIALELSLFCSSCGFNGLVSSGLGHSLLFSNDNSLLLFGSFSSGKSSIECFDFCQEGIIASIIAGNALFLCLYNGLLLLFGNCFLLLGGLCSSVSSIELLHIALEFSLFSSFSNLSGFACCSLLGHSLLFGNDNSLFLFGSFSGGKGSIECSDFGSGCIKLGGAGNTLLLCLDNGLLLLFDNILLFFGRYSGGQGRVKNVHFSFELILFSGSCNRLFGCGTNHSLLFGTDQSIFCLRSLSCIVSGIEGSNFGLDNIGADFLCGALLLCLDDNLLFCLDNSLLLFLGLSALELIAQSVHFGLELSLFFGENGSLLACLQHRLLFCLNNSVLLLRRFS